MANYLRPFQLLPWQRELVGTGRKILKSVGIDPILGYENLVWAPNVAGQHSTAALRAIVEALQSTVAAGGGQAEIVATLQRMGSIAARR